MYKELLMSNALHIENIELSNYALLLVVVLLLALVSLLLVGMSRAIKAVRR